MTTQHADIDFVRLDASELAGCRITRASVDGEGWLVLMLEGARVAAVQVRPDDMFDNWGIRITTARTEHD